MPSDADIVAGAADDMARARSGAQKRRPRDCCERGEPRQQHEEAVRAFEQKRTQRERLGTRRDSEGCETVFSKEGRAAWVSVSVSSGFP